jgi:Protein of unknown function (DUF3379)
MNCEELRRLVGADPASETSEIAAHAAACDECARYRRELRDFDKLLHRALMIDVAATPKRTRSAPRVTRWAAAAAAVIVGGLGLWLSLPKQSFAEQLVAHVGGEPKSLAVTDVAVDPAELNRVLEHSGVRLKPGVGTITYAMSCWFRGHYVPHLVVQGEQGAVTVLLLRDERSVERSKRFHEQGFDGVIVPAPRGAIAVLARESQVAEIADRFLRAVEYVERS